MLVVVEREILLAEFRVVTGAGAPVVGEGALTSEAASKDVRDAASRAVIDVSFVFKRGGDAVGNSVAEPALGDLEASPVR